MDLFADKGTENTPSEDANAGSASAGTAEEEEEEESESESNNDATLQEELQEFRQRWQRELQEAGQLAFRDGDVEACAHSKEEQAKILFSYGVQAEQDRDLYGAIHYYRRAMQLVPDIESKIDFVQQRSPRERQDSESSVESSFSVEEDLVQQFQGTGLENKGLCQPEYQQRAAHISSLPNEVLMYIFRWVVSPELDLRSLEMAAQVCKGFYLCARDEGLWRSACHRVWGNNCGNSKKYGGWRKMYLERPHLMFNGVYISRTTYVRQGEQSMDMFYRPFHVVAYYRFLRFFPEGNVIMVCSPEEPTLVVSKLRSAACHIPGMMRGYYKVSGNKVMCVMKRLKPPPPPVRYKRQRQAANQNDIDQTYTMEFEMTDCNRRRHCRLNWVSYKVSGHETGNFELKDSAFPALIFSRVKSYTAVAEAALE